MIADPQVRAWHRALLVGSVGLVSVAAWAALWQYGALLHTAVHQHHDAGAAPAWLFVSAWTVMTIAMMLPTSVPLVATFHTIVGRRPDRAVLITLAIVGYLLVWALTGLVFYVGWILIQRLGWWQAHAALGSAAAFLVAGAYQFTSLKYRCLDKCRSPLSFVLGYWQGERERRNALRLGAHHGLFCVGCCWALMLLMFAVGVGSLGWMLVLGAAMAVEKNVPWGRALSAPLGGALVFGGLALLALA
jgi:predicted metal-binding membrane protein